MVAGNVGEAQYRPGSSWRLRPGQSVQAYRPELFLDPLRHRFLVVGVIIRKGNLAVSVDGHRSREPAARNIASDLRFKAGKITPLRASGQRFLEKRHRFGVRVLTLKRPGQREGGEIAYLRVLPAAG